MNLQTGTGGVPTAFRIRFDERPTEQEVMVASPHAVVDHRPEFGSRPLAPAQVRMRQWGLGYPRSQRCRTLIAGLFGEGKANHGLRRIPRPECGIELGHE